MKLSSAFFFFFGKLSEKNNWLDILSSCTQKKSLKILTIFEGNCSFSRNLAGTWAIDKDDKELGRMSIGYTRMDVTFMGQRYIYTCNQFDYSQEKYLLR